MTRRKKQRKGLMAVRAKLTAEESLRRMEEFARRKRPFVASVRKGKDGGGFV